MGRILPVALSLLALVGVLYLPEADPDRLSALGAHELLAEEVERDGELRPLWQHVLEDAGGEGEVEVPLGPTLAQPTAARLAVRSAGELLALPVGAAVGPGAEGPDPNAGRPLWQVLVDGPATVREGTTRTFRLRGTRLVADPGYLPDIEDHYHLRLALAEEMRELTAADPEYADVVVQGEHEPTPEGASFLLSYRAGEQVLEVNPVSGAPPIEVHRPWQAPTPNDADLRRSLVRGLRALAGDSDGYAGFTIRGEHEPVAGGAAFRLRRVGANEFLDYAVGGDAELTTVERAWTAPDRRSILPPLVAVVLAILFRRPLLALFLGVATGAVLVRAIATEVSAATVAAGVLDVGRTYFWNEFTDPDRAQIIGFVVFMLAMVGVMTRAGGIRGMMDAVAARARDVRRTQIATYLMGLVIFFDDYANTILVGATMRPLTDRFRIAREKLAYIVDSTAAPVAGLSVFSTWIAFEVSTFNQQLPAAGMSPDDGYAVFLRTIPYSFYCFLTLVMVGLVAYSGKDLGPMLSAERRARKTGQLLRPGATPMVSETATTMDSAPGVEPRAWRGLLPLVTFLVVTLFEIARVGGAFQSPLSALFTIEGATRVLYDGSGSWPLLVGSIAGFLVAAVGAATAGLAGDVPRAAFTTLRSMAVAFAILYLAWMIGAVCGDLGTAPYLTALVGASLDPLLLPTLLFLLAGVVAFATGSSWSTMSILLPLVVGLAYNLGLPTELAGTAAESGELLMVMGIGAVLSGAIFGDHCSPISDTTVMSSIASASDHIDHVRTQAPYALIAMAASVACGYLPAAYLGLSPWLGLGLGTLLLAAVVFGLGRRAEPAPTP